MEQTYESKKTTVTVPEIACGGCAAAIKNVFANNAAVRGVDVNVAEKRVTLTHSENFGEHDLAEALGSAGFTYIETGDKG